MSSTPTDFESARKRSQAGLTMIEMVIATVIVGGVMSLAIVGMLQAMEVTNMTTRSSYYQSQAERVLNQVVEQLKDTSRDQLALFGLVDYEGETYATQALYKVVTGYDVDNQELDHADDWSFMGQRHETEIDLESLEVLSREPASELHLVAAVNTPLSDVLVSPTTFVDELGTLGDELTEDTMISDKVQYLLLERPNGLGTRQLNIRLIMEFEDYEREGETVEVDVERALTLRN